MTIVRQTFSWLVILTGQAKLTGKLYFLALTLEITKTVKS